jgi:hypothetical protein
VSRNTSRECTRKDTTLGSSVTARLDCFADRSPDGMDPYKVMPPYWSE